MKNLIRLVEMWEGDLALKEKEWDKMIERNYLPEACLIKQSRIRELEKCIQEVKRYVLLEEEK